MNELTVADWEEQLDRRREFEALPCCGARDLHKHDCAYISALRDAGHTRENGYTPPRTQPPPAGENLAQSVNNSVSSKPPDCPGCRSGATSYVEGRGKLQGVRILVCSSCGYGRDRLAAMPAPKRRRGRRGGRRR